MHALPPNALTLYTSMLRTRVREGYDVEGLARRCFEYGTTGFPGCCRGHPEGTPAQTDVSGPLALRCTRMTGVTWRCIVSDRETQERQAKDLVALAGRGGSSPLSDTSTQCPGTASSGLPSRSDGFSPSSASSVGADGRGVNRAELRRTVRNPQEGVPGTLRAPRGHLRGE